MRLQISRLGQQFEVDFTDADRIRFPEGIIGFETHTEFVLLPDQEGGLQWLHASTGDPVGFAVVDPFLIWPDYDVTVPDADAAALALQQPQDAQVLVIITPREDPSQISANLRAPIVINRRLRQGRQIILQNASYAVHAPVLAALTTAQQRPGLLGTDLVETTNGADQDDDGAPESKRAAA